MILRNYDKELKNVDEIHRVLDSNGDLIDKKHQASISKDDLLKAYSFMVLSRQQDTYMSQLQRQGRMLTFPPNFGEEALQVAVASAMEKQDWFVPAFRSNATMLQMGVPIRNQFWYWNGNEKGSKIPNNVNVLPVNIPIATQISHAAGIAYSMKMKKTDGVAVTFIGNGGPAEGEFYEALNFASIHKLPMVACVNNNKWAISTPEKFETASRSIAIKSVAMGIPGTRVDGNDLLASYEAIKEAMDYARAGNGPILVEFMTWRQGPHTSSDDPRLYRTEAQEKEEEKWEPFHRIEKYLMDKKILSAEGIEKLKADQLEQVKAEYQASLTDIEVSIDEVFDHTYETLTTELEEQKNEALAYFGGKNGK